MRKNRKRKAILHSALKANRRETGGRRRTLLIVLAGVLVAAAAAGVTLAYRELYSLWISQCVVTDRARQITVTAGQNVKPEVILESFGLTNGCNLARIDFRRKRDEIMAKIPNIRALTVTRHLPDRVDIVFEEREPVARLNVLDDRGVARRTPTGRVVDAEGVVFERQAGTQMMPTIFERDGSHTKPGQRLTGRALATLRLLEYCRDGEAAELGIQRVDATRPDCLFAILGNYSQLNIAWTGMDSPTAETRAAMEKQLMHLVKAYKTRLATPSNGIASVVVWNATEPGVIYADTKEPIQ